MPSVRGDMRAPWLILLFLGTALGLGLLGAVAYPLDDHFLYQRFAQSLAAGRLDLAIAGFHGSDVFAALWHLVRPSPVSQIEAQLLFGLALPVAGYLAARSLHRSEECGLLMAMILTMSPFIVYSGLRGWTGASLAFLFLLTIPLILRRSRLAGVTWALAILTKPFALGLLPLALLYAPPGGPWWKRHRTILAAGILVAIYLGLQLLQAGRILIGAHENLTAASVWEGPARWLLNAAHALQILFSVHNFVPTDPAKTGAGNLMHTTPVLVFLGLWSLSRQAEYLRERRLALALGAGAALALALNVPLDHMDHYYMEAGVLLLILAALPILRRSLPWMLLTFATLHFQWLYFWLEFRQAYLLTPVVFAPVVAVDALVLAWAIGRLRGGQGTEG